MSVGMKVCAVAVAVLLVVVIVMAAIIRSFARKLSDARKSAEDWKCYSRKLEKRVELLEKEDRIKNENRAEAEKKIADLHNGNSVDNAIAGLCNNSD